MDSLWQRKKSWVRPSELSMPKQQDNHRKKVEIHKNVREYICNVYTILSIIKKL